MEQLLLLLLQAVADQCQLPFDLESSCAFQRAPMHSRELLWMYESSLCPRELLCSREFMCVPESSYVQESSCVLQRAPVCISESCCEFQRACMNLWSSCQFHRLPGSSCNLQTISLFWNPRVKTGLEINVRKTKLMAYHDPENIIIIVF